MVKQIADIKLYGVQDLHDALGVNMRTIRDWFNKGRLKGVKIGKEWYITEDNLKAFLSGQEGGEKPSSKVRAVRKTKRKKEKT